MIFNATLPSESYRYQKNILQHLIFVVKMKLVSTVFVYTSLCKSGWGGRLIAPSPPNRSYGPVLFLGAGGVVNDVIGQRFIMVPRRQTVETGNTNIWVSNTGREFCTFTKNNNPNFRVLQVNFH